MNEAAMTVTGPAAVSSPTTHPPKTCPCAPARLIVSPPDMEDEDEDEDGEGGRYIPESDNISNRPR